MSDSVFKKPCIPPLGTSSPASTHVTDTSSNMASKASSASAVSSRPSIASDPSESTKEERQLWYRQTMAKINKMSRKEKREMLEKAGHIVGPSLSHDFGEDIEYEQSNIKN